MPVFDLTVADPSESQRALVHDMDVVGSGTPLRRLPRRPVDAEYIPSGHVPNSLDLGRGAAAAEIVERALWAMLHSLRRGERLRVLHALGHRRLEAYLVDLGCFHGERGSAASVAERLLLVFDDIETCWEQCGTAGHTPRSDSAGTASCDLPSVIDQVWIDLVAAGPFGSQQVIFGKPKTELADWMSAIGGDPVGSHLALAPRIFRDVACYALDWEDAVWEEATEACGFTHDTSRTHNGTGPQRVWDAMRRVATAPSEPRRRRRR